MTQSPWRLRSFIPAWAPFLPTGARGRSRDGTGPFLFGSTKGGIKVSGWMNSKSDSRKAATLGVRVGRGNVEQYVDKRLVVVYVEMDGTAVPVKITARFWNKTQLTRSGEYGS